MLKESKSPIDTLVLPNLTPSLIRAILYFDIFNYPLRAEEIWRACDTPGADVQAVQAALEILVHAGILAEEEGLYYMPNRESPVPRRLRGNALAERRMLDARRNARRIAAFPYVEGVMASGSLSKNYMEPGSDIDFFIVTRPGRLWVARTLLILYKKVFLLNSHKNFCVNYFVDQEHLEIEDKNIFTATETVYLAPLVNPGLYQRFRAGNGWADAQYPNFGLLDTKNCTPLRRPWYRRMAEGILGGKLGDRVDGWCMRRTLQRWKHKFPGFDQAKFEVALRTRKYVSKHHPADYQGRVLNKLSTKYEAFEAQYGISLRPWPFPSGPVK